jgi:hypothetical protein
MKMRMTEIRLILPLLGFALATPAAAQVSGCARDMNGALQCGFQSPPGQVRSPLPSRNPARRTVEVDAARRQAAALQAERDARDKEGEAADERRGAERRNCLARAGNNPAALSSCPL